MLQDPAKYIPALAAAGASSITFQIEPFLEAAASTAASGDAAQAATQAAAALAADIRSRGMKAGVALAVGTSTEAVLPLVMASAVDLVSNVLVRYSEPCQGSASERRGADDIDGVL
jgi:pentose-5-phosphate-3-epimerase